MFRNAAIGLAPQDFLRKCTRVLPGRSREVIHPLLLAGSGAEAMAVGVYKDIYGTFYEILILIDLYL